MTALAEETLVELEGTIESFDVEMTDEAFRISMCGSGCIDCSAQCENDCVECNDEIFKSDKF